MAKVSVSFPGTSSFKTWFTNLHEVFVGELQYVSLTPLLNHHSLLWPFQSLLVDQPQPPIAPGNRGLSTWLLLGCAAIFARLPHFALRAPESDLAAVGTKGAITWELACSFKDREDTAR